MKLKHITNNLALLAFLLFLYYGYIYLLLWGIIEAIVYAIKTKKLKFLRDFICNFVQTILNCINILCNILFQVPANRVLLTTTENAPSLFGNHKDSFTKVLRLNFIHGNLKPRGTALYNIISFF